MTRRTVLSAAVVAGMLGIAACGGGEEAGQGTELESSGGMEGGASGTAGPGTGSAGMTGGATGAAGATSAPMDTARGAGY